MRYDLVKTKVDKDSNDVTVDKNDYLSKMMTIMYDNSNFKLLGPVTHQNDKTLKKGKIFVLF